jgi:hypothetical protein
LGGVFEVLLLLSPEPTLADCERFPPAPFACAALEFNRAYHNYIESRQAIGMHHWWYWDEVLTETDYLYHCWDALYTARRSHDDDVRRGALERLRELIGEEAYFQGTMPPSVPVWRFLKTN